MLTAIKVFAQGMKENRLHPERHSPSDRAWAAMKSTSKLISNAFLIGMHDASREAFQEQAEEHRYAPGETLFEAGESARCFFLICSGSVHEHLADDTRVRLGEGDLVGASCLVPPHRRLSTATASSEVEALAFDCSHAQHLCESDHEFGFALYQRLFGVMVDRLAATTDTRSQATGR